MVELMPHYVQQKPVLKHTVQQELRWLVSLPRRWGKDSSVRSSSIMVGANSLGQTDTVLSLVLMAGC